MDDVNLTLPHFQKDKERYEDDDVNGNDDDSDIDNEDVDGNSHDDDVRARRNGIDADDHKQ